MSKTQGAEIVTFRVEYRFQLERVKKEKLDEVVANNKVDIAPRTSSIV